MKNHVVLFFAFAMVSLLSGCAGTRLCSKIWSVGTSEDYIMNPLYAKSKLFVADDEYYLQCTQRTYHDNPKFYFIFTPPLSYSPNDISYIENSEKQVTVKISPEFAHTLQLEHEVWDLPKEDSSPYYDFLLYVDNVCPALPDGAEPLAINLRDELREDDDVWGYELSLWVNGTDIRYHKSAESYLLTPLMIPALAVDITSWFAWPLNIIVAMPFLNNDCYSSYETGEVNESIE